MLNQQRRLVPDAVFTAPLKRSFDTARLAVEALGCDLPITIDPRFNEIDYGPDENQPESVVVARIGDQALRDWNDHAKVPPGWLAFGNTCRQCFSGRTVLVVTSNGMARFAPHLTGDFEGFRRRHCIKIATGALCFL